MSLNAKKLSNKVQKRKIINIFNEEYTTLKNQINP